MPFYMIRNDITKMKTDAVVNPANPGLEQGSGTSRAVYLAAGEEKLTKACRKIGSCPPGKAVITRGFDLPAKYIIHTTGPVWKGADPDNDRILYSAYWESMCLARRRRLKSIAFPLLSAGNYAYPREEALRIALSAIRDFLLREDLLVYLVLYDKESVAVGHKLFASVEEYIDDHYVSTRTEACTLSSDSRQRYLRELQATVFSRSDGPAEMPDAAALFSAPPMEERSLPPKEKIQAPKGKARAPKEPKRSFAAVRPKRSLEDLLKGMDETFTQMLLRLIDEKGLTDVQVYRRANIDRRLFSKIRSNIHYTPGKKTILALAVAMELSLDETKDLLLRAGYALSNSSRFDVIITYFIENGRYDIFEINEVLFAYSEPLLGA